MNGELDGEGGESGSGEKDAPAALNVNDNLVENEKPLSLELPVEHELESSAYAALTATLVKQPITLWSSIGWFSRGPFYATVRSTHPIQYRLGVAVTNPVSR